METSTPANVQEPPWPHPHWASARLAGPLKLLRLRCEDPFWGWCWWAGGRALQLRKSGVGIWRGLWREWRPTSRARRRLPWSGRLSGLQPGALACEPWNRATPVSNDHHTWRPRLSGFCLRRDPRAQMPQAALFPTLLRWSLFGWLLAPKVPQSSARPQASPRAHRPPVSRLHPQRLHNAPPLPGSLSSMDGLLFMGPSQPKSRERTTVERCSGTKQTGPFPLLPPALSRACNPSGPPPALTYARAQGTGSLLISVLLPFASQASVPTVSSAQVHVELPRTTPASLQHATASTTPLLPHPNLPTSVSCLSIARRRLFLSQQSVICTYSVDWPVRLLALPPSPGGTVPLPAAEERDRWFLASRDHLLIHACMHARLHTLLHYPPRRQHQHYG
ncbi:hypothetical protein M011DRAFT_76696 [Sporormia fimetaria CBS 119925]|uniref:Uncharacterized protein n=1 Tax=Sporormia fimetaria CBS 119925 TaxID=1340428 RepID=A0A6A6V9B7_9PLEO|nr:hypothetical protein M011DRAFT_76696 [Sporormia fimetaria CBS 119925]